jgi:hypothetical protein
MKMPREAAKELESRLVDMEPDYLLCRDLRHPWQPYDAKRDSKSKTITRVLVCPRCGTLRHDVMDYFGFVLSQRYTYPKGYKMPGGPMVSGDRAMIRLLNTTRGFEK